MVARLVWKRFRNDWLQFGKIGLWTFLGALPPLMIPMLAGAWYLGGYLSGRLGGQPAPNPARASAVFMGLLALTAAATAAIWFAGMMGQLVAYRRGEPVGFGAFWRSARRNGAAMLLPAIIWGILGSLGNGSFQASPLRTTVIELITAYFVLNLGIYPAYLIVADDLKVLPAMGRGLKLLLRHPREALTGAFHLCVANLGFALLGDLAKRAMPLSLILWLIFLLFWIPLLPYYFTERFEQQVRPLLQ